MKNVFKFLGAAVGTIAIGATIIGVFNCLATKDESETEDNENETDEESEWDEEIGDLEEDEIQVTKLDNSSENENESDEALNENE